MKKILTAAAVVVIGLVFVGFIGSSHWFASLHPREQQIAAVAAVAGYIALVVAAASRHRAVSQRAKRSSSGYTYGR